MNIEEIKKTIKGEVFVDSETLKRFSKDTSLFQVMPKAVIAPRDVDDIKKLVTYISEQKEFDKDLSITVRAAGTDMTGGPLNESIILDVTKSLNKKEVDPIAETAVVEPGLFYRDFEKVIKPHNLTLPSFPASKSLAALGGIVMNNSAGEMTLRYGQTRNFVNEVSMVLADGEEYSFKEIGGVELKRKMAKKSFEGIVYREIYELIQNNYDLIHNAKPNVSKNSSGYALWDVYNPEKKTMNLAQLFVGSQGTLGIMTQAKLRLVKEKPKQQLIALFFKDWTILPQVVNEILPFDPESTEAFDDATMMLGIRFMPEIAKKARESFLKFASRFIPEVGIGIRMLGMPKLVVLVQLAEDSDHVLEEKTKAIVAALKKYPVIARVSPSKADADKYWIMRRESFNLLRKHVQGKRTAPFVEDFCVRPEQIPSFLPRAVALLKKHGITVNITGHAGNGNFHIIPLMDLKKESEREKIPVVADEFYKLINEYDGTITAEHNDGIIRTPYVKDMFGPEVYNLFEQVKDIFDPLNIFNPGKKVRGDLDFLRDHIVKE